MTTPFEARPDGRLVVDTGASSWDLNRSL